MREFGAEAEARKKGEVGEGLLDFGLLLIILL